MAGPTGEFVGLLRVDSDPVPGTATGRVFWNNIENKLKLDNGTEIVELWPDLKLHVTDGGGLTADYTGGTLIIPSSSGGLLFVSISSGSIALTDNATNYIQVADTGIIFNSTVEFFSSSVPIAKVITSGGVITSIEQRFSVSDMIQFSNRFHMSDLPFPQQIWGINNASITGFLDVEMGDLALQALPGAGNNHDIFFGSGPGSANQMQSPNGSPGSPVYTFLGDLTSGFFLSGAEIGISISGVDRFRALAPAVAQDIGIKVEHNTGAGNVLKQVTAGAANSGGVGFRLLRIVN